MSNKKNISCEIVQGSLADYSVGILNASKTDQIKAHLGSCKACARELSMMEGAVALVETVEAIEPPAGVWDAVYEQIKDSPASTPSFGEKIRNLFASPKRTLATGFAVLVILVALTFGQMQKPFDTPVADASSTYEYVQGHAMFSSQDVFSNRAGLASVTGEAMLVRETQTQ